jgi:hypothetical protein
MTRAENSEEELPLWSVGMCLPPMIDQSSTAPPDEEFE